MIGPVQKMVLLSAEKGLGVTRIAGTAKQCSRRCAIIYVSKASLSAPKGPGGFAGGIGDRRVRQSERSRAFGDAEEPELHGKNHRTRGTDTCLKRPASEGRSSNSGTETCPGRSLTRSARGSGTCMVKPRGGTARVNVEVCLMNDREDYADDGCDLLGKPDCRTPPDAAKSTLAKNPGTIR